MIEIIITNLATIENAEPFYLICKDLDKLSVVDSNLRIIESSCQFLSRAAIQAFILSLLPEKPSPKLLNVLSFAIKEKFAKGEIIVTTEWCKLIAYYTNQSDDMSIWQDYGNAIIKSDFLNKEVNWVCISEAVSYIV